MTGYGFFRSIRYILGLIAFVLAGLVVCIFTVTNEIRREADFQHRYGDNWRMEYEQMFGSVTEARTRTAIGMVGFVAILVAAAWLFRVLTNNNRRRPKSKVQHASESAVGRVTRYRRNALLGVYFGVPAIFFSILLTIFRFGIFADHSNEVALAIFVFMGGYSAVVCGCYWWLKAKGWTEAVVFIAFMPLTIFLVPFVRMIVFAAPQLLMAAMVMTPLILVVVVAVLPDKSGRSRRRATWEKRQ